MGIGLTILKHKDLIGSTASAVGNAASAIKSVKDAQKECCELQAIKEIKKGKTQLSPQEKKILFTYWGQDFKSLSVKNMYY